MVKTFQKNTFEDIYKHRFQHLPVFFMKETVSYVIIVYWYETSVNMVLILFNGPKQGTEWYFKMTTQQIGKLGSLTINRSN